MLKKLPVDVSTFSLLIKNKYLYVDKTKFAHDLITGGRRFFLSRPRRFGKSLFLSTLEEILQGNRSLFKGLWIGRSGYKWLKYGVITLDFSSFENDRVESFKKELCESLEEVARNYGLRVFVDHASPSLSLKKVVRALYAKFGRRVSLRLELSPFYKKFNYRNFL